MDFNLLNIASVECVSLLFYRGGGLGGGARMMESEGDRQTGCELSSGGARGGQRDGGKAKGSLILTVFAAPDGGSEKTVGAG